MQTRPFRAPHHSASQPALIGGGQKAKPGEISLAHQGVLFLDELPEFARGTLESLRQPLETGDALIARVNAHVKYPARFQLIAAMNPCRCGYLGDPDQECTKAPRCGSDYQSKISGPLMDRIDLHVDVPAVKISDLQGAEMGESSAEVANRVNVARSIQKARFGVQGFEGRSPINANVDGKWLEDITPMSSSTRDLLRRSVEQAKLSARGYYRILRVARTIADLSGGAEEITQADIAEALSYRRLALG